MQNTSLFDQTVLLPRPTGAAWGSAAVLTLLLFSAPLWPDLHFFSSPEYYLPIHAAMETFSIVVAGLVFAIGWSTHGPERSGNFLLLGCVFLAVGLLDFLHTFSYVGMPSLVTPSSTEKAIQFWLAARLLAATALLMVALLPWERRLQPGERFLWLGVALLLAAAVTAVVLFRPYWLPRTFIEGEGEGLTLFKIGAEYAVVVMYGVAAFLLWRRRLQEREVELAWLAAASWVMGLAELYFTLYSHVGDMFNLAGHVYKVIAYGMVYRALFVSSVREPYERLRQNSLLRLKLTQYAVDHGGDMVFWVDPEGQILSSNKAAQERLGYDERGLSGLYLSAVDRGLEHKGWGHFWAELCQRERIQAESLYQTRDGERLPVELIANHVAFEGGEYLCAFVRDISDRKRVEDALRAGEIRLKEGQRIANIGSWELNHVEGVLVWSDEIYRIFEVDRRRFHASYENFLAMIHPEDRARVDRAFTESVERRAPYEVNHRLLLPNGRVKYVVERGETYYSTEGGPIRSLGTVQDITREVESEQALREANLELTRRADELLEQQRKTRLLNDMGELLLTCHNSRETYGVIGNFAQRLFPGSSGALFIIAPGREWVDGVARWGQQAPSEERFSVEQCWTLRLNRRHQVDDPTQELVCPHVSELPPAGYVDLPVMAQGELLGVIQLNWPESQLQLAAERRRQLREIDVQLASTMTDHLALTLMNLRLRDSLQQQAIRDPLTGLYNRRYLDDALIREIHRVNSRKSSLGIMMLDLDHFKRVNDEYGHDAGDALLRGVANLVRTHIRAEDLVCRYGGEEFVILLPEVGLDGSVARAEQLRKAASSLAVNHEGRQVGPVTISIGVAVSPDHGSSVEKVLKAADDALYRAKQAGRDQVATAG